MPKNDQGQEMMIFALQAASGLRLVWGIDKDDAKRRAYEPTSTKATLIGTELPGKLKPGEKWTLQGGSLVAIPDPDYVPQKTAEERLSEIESRLEAAGL